MKRPLLTTFIAGASALTAVLVAGVARSQAPAAAPNAEHRYSTQMVVLPGTLGSVVTITDHQEQKLHFYRLEEDRLELRDTVDLTKAGQSRIERKKASEPPAPATK